jgi:small subunit ribosomal protein S5
MAKGRQKFRQKKEKPEFDQSIADLSRVTRVTSGGKQLSFRACVVIGDRKGRVGYGVEKGKDVQIAVEKAVNQAKKNLIHVPMVFDTVPHRVLAKYKAGRVMITPAPRGSGVIAGSVIRLVLELAGVQNVSAKMLGKTNNKIINVKATFEALQSFNPAAVKKATFASNKEDANKNVKKSEKTIVEEKNDKKTIKKVEKKVAPKKTIKKVVDSKKETSEKEITKK